MNREIGSLEWSPVQKAFHFRDNFEKEVDGWYVVASGIKHSMASDFIMFLNTNWRRREGLSPEEIAKIFDVWTEVYGGSNG